MKPKKQNQPGSMSEWVKYQDRAMPDTTTTDTTTTTVTTVEPTKGTGKPNQPFIKIYFVYLFA